MGKKAASSAGWAGLFVKAILGIVLLATLVGLVYAIVLFSGRCSDRILEQQSSPDGRWVATWLERDCGATTLQAYHLLLTPAGSKPALRDGELLFTCTALGGRRLSWQSPHLLEVEAECNSIFRQESKKKGVSIFYKLSLQPAGAPGREDEKNR